MKYIIMCGGVYREWDKPKQLLKINGEPIVARTIRLLKEAGVEDIAISSNNEAFDYFGVPRLEHFNSYDATGYNNFKGYWCDAFYPTDAQACYIFGDVVFSPEAIRTIVATQTDDIEFFASAPPFAKNYMKPFAEPFALKVRNQKHLRYSIAITKQYADAGMFARKPIMWELWQVIKGTPINRIDYTNYIVINDWTCDIDYPGEVTQFERILKELQ